MPLVQAIILGIVQGLTEFLPISSTAHLVVIPRLLGWPPHSLAFDIALHVGTLAAVILYFFRDWVQVLAQGFGLNIGGDPVLARNRKLLWLLVGATIPIGIAGLLFQHQAETSWRDNLYIIGGTAIGVGLILWYAEYAGRKQKDIGHISPVDAVAIGLGQALAVVPGTSRSGITIAVGLLRNLDRQTAARFSFLLLTPAVAAAAAKDFWDLMKQGGIPPDLRTAFIAGIAVSAISGCLAIRFLLNYLRRRSLTVFIFYRLIFGIIVIALAFFRFGGG